MKIQICVSFCTEYISSSVLKRSGPSCSKLCQLNAIVKTSTHKVHADYISKYTVIFVDKNNSVFVILPFEILTNRELISSLILNNLALMFSTHLIDYIV